MTEITPQEYERLKPFLYHVVAPEMADAMAALRAQHLQVALTILREQPASRSQSIALTHLEEAQMRAIQGLAMAGEPQLPPGFVVKE